MMDGMRRRRRVRNNSPPEQPSFGQAKAAARGQWQMLLPALGISEEHLSGRHGPCPGCGGKDRFRFDDKDDGRWICSQGGGSPASGDGIDLLIHAGICGNRADALRRVLEAVALSPLEPPEQSMRDGGQHRPSKPWRSADRDKASAAQEMWRRSAPLVGTTGEIYLRSRGLVGPWPETLLWLPLDAHNAVNIEYRKIAGWAPVGCVGVVLAGLTSPQTGLLAAVHRIFISRKGEKIERRALGPIAGNACRLDPGPNEAGDWGLTEGIESALAVRQLTGSPVWAAISASNMANILPPPGAKRSTVWADNDEAGLAWAEKAAQRRDRGGFEARIIAAKEPGADMNDLLMKGGDIDD